MSDLGLKSVSLELVLERLRFENPWWTSGSGQLNNDNLPRRLFFNDFFTLVRQEGIVRSVVLMGPRRIGKTVMMHHAISGLLQEGVQPRKIAFVNMENPILLHVGLDQLFGYVRLAVGDNTLEGWYIFFDEIQYLQDWEVHLKVLTDSYPKSRFIASGSAAAVLKMKSRESGAGRFTDFHLPPLTFQEFIHLKGLTHLLTSAVAPGQVSIPIRFSTTHIRELNQEFIEYLNFGGYPEVLFAQQIRQQAGRFIRSDIVDKVLLRDLPSLYGIEDVQDLNRFFATIAFNSGAEISYQSLSNASGISKKIIRNYLAYLEAAFLIRLVHRVDDNAQRFKRADYFKVYLTNPSLRSALFAPLVATDDAMGGMVETALYAQWQPSVQNLPLYARWSNGRYQGEVDMIGMDIALQKPLWAVEVKWSNYYVTNPGRLDSLLVFCKNNGLASATVTTIDTFAKLNYNNIELNFVPASIFAFNAGANNFNTNNYDKI